MTPQKVRKVLKKFVKDISYFSVDAMLENEKETIKELSEKLAKVFKTSSEVDSYLNHILAAIDSLNKYFSKQKGGGKIPYSRLLTFANKDKRLSEFLFDVAASKKLGGSERDADIGMAGFEFKEEVDIPAVVFNDEIYSHIYTKGGSEFFFSMIKERLVVRIFGKKVMSYVHYKKKRKQANAKYVTVAEIFKKVKKIEERTVAISSYLIFCRNKKAERARNERRKNKKKLL